MGRRKKQYPASDFIKAIPGTGGIIATIAKRVGCDWWTAKRAIDRYPTVSAAYSDECETVNDLAESTLIKSIKDGDVAAAKWWLTKNHVLLVLGNLIKVDIGSTDEPNPAPFNYMN